MARDHARIHLAIWKNDDWRDLSHAAQHMFFVLLAGRLAGVEDRARGGAA